MKLDVSNLNNFLVMADLLPLMIRMSDSKGMFYCSVSGSHWGFVVELLIEAI